MRTAIFAGVLSLVAAAFDGGCSRCSPESRDAEAEVGTAVVCPVCGLEFDRSEAVATRDYQGKKYHFLLEDHARAFEENPGSYLKKKQ